VAHSGKRIKRHRIAARNARVSKIGRSIESACYRRAPSARQCSDMNVMTRARGDNKHARRQNGGACAYG